LLVAYLLHLNGPRFHRPGAVIYFRPKLGGNSGQPTWLSRRNLPLFDGSLNHAPQYLADVLAVFFNQCLEGLLLLCGYPESD
jgi:hypothetical protein